MKYDKEYKELEDKYIALQAEFDQYKKESIKWGVEDFMDYDTEGEYTITEEQAQEALLDMINNHDCNHGITWGDVEFYIEKYGTKKEDILC